MALKLDALLAEWGWITGIWLWVVNTRTGVAGDCCRLVSCVRLFVTSMDCSPPGSSDNRISQAKIPERVAISFSRGSSQLRDWTHISCAGRWILYHWAAWETHCRSYTDCAHTSRWSRSACLLVAVCLSRCEMSITGAAFVLCFAVAPVLGRVPGTLERFRYLLNGCRKNDL